MLEDIAVLTGANFISADTGRQLKDVTVEDLGRADSVRSTKDETFIVGGKGTKRDLDARVAQIDKKVDNSDSDYDIEELEKRKSKLTGGVAVIQVGASTEVEMKNLQERVKDAKGATKAAIEEGIIPGGGVTLLRAEKVLDKLTASNDDEQAGIDLIKSVLDEPMRMLATNSGEDAGWIVGQIKAKGKANWGFNALTNKFEDLVSAGVIEPAKVAISSLRNAASVASMILTTECMVTDAPPKKGENSAMPAMPQGGGMPGMM